MFDNRESAGWRLAQCLPEVSQHMVLESLGRHLEMGRAPARARP